MIVKVLKRIDAGGSEFEVLDEFEIAGVDPLRVTPVHEKVGSLLSVQGLKELFEQIQPLQPPSLAEPDSYYAQNVDAWQDGDLSRSPIDIPHHVGLRVALAGILQKYNAPDYLIEIG